MAPPPSAPSLASMALFVLMGGLSSCTDYNLTPEDKAEDGLEETGQPDETGTPDSGEPGEDCPDATLPGFDATANEECLFEVATGTFTPVEEWSVTSFAKAAAYNNVMMQPIVASLTDDDGDGDIDGDDVPDVIFTSYQGSSWTSAGALRAHSGDGGAELWTDLSMGIEGSGGVAAGDIDGDGIVEIVAVAASPKRVVAFEHDGTVKWQSSTLSLGSCYATSPALADLDGDGDVEIIVANVVLDSSGTVVGTGPSGYLGGCVSFAADIDADGTQEVIAGGSVFRRDGTSIWNRSTEGYAAVADFDADGQGEVVVVNTSGIVSLFDTDGTPLWSTPSAYGYGPPTIADFDGDGEPEVGVAGSSTYTVIETDGSRRWQNSTTDASSGRTGSSVFDFEGDGVAEVVYADEYNLWVYSGEDGSVKLQETNHTSWTWIEYATIADVDGDDQAEIIVPHGSIGGSSSGAVYGISVVGDADESWRPGRKIWNQHAYSITNVDDDGGIPSSPDLNWLSYNSFRSGDTRQAEGSTAPDVVLTEGDLCELDCDEDRLRLWVHPGNQGLAATVADAELVVTAEVGGSLVELERVALSDPLVSGLFDESVQVDFEDADLDTWTAIEVELVLDEPECDDTNNVLRIEGPFCD